MDPTRNNHPPQGGDPSSNPSSQPVTAPLQVRIDLPPQGPSTLQWVSPQARSSAPTSPSSAYSTDREAIIQRTNPGSTTIAETHVLRSTGMQSQSFTEEHWTSEIKSFVACVPPKFLQVIKAYRVLSTDTLTLVVEVVSDPPAIFEWFVNDRPVLADRRRFSARHGLNITSLTVHSPEGGVYKCTARNPAGVSTSYGYVNISAPPRYEEWSESSRLARQEEHSSRSSLVIVNQAPRFLNQVPNLTLQPGCEAVLDVEVDANPPARFQWFVNGFEHVDGSGRVEYFYPNNNRCVARFIIPVAGEYKVVATNVHGTAISSGFVEIYKPNPSKSMRPPVAPGERISRSSGMTMSGIGLAPPRDDHRERTAEGDSILTTREVTEVEMNYYQRSSSLPRQSRQFIERHVELPTLTPTSGRSRQTSEPRETMGVVETEMAPRPLHKSKSETARYLPQPPVFVTHLPAEVLLTAEDRLVLSVDAAALPTATFTWTANGFELRSSKNLTLLHEQNRSTLVAQPPVKAGRYSVTARNDVGSATVTTKVRHLPGAEREAQPAPEFLESAVTVTSPEPPSDEVGSTTSSVETVVRPSEDRPIVVPVPIPEESTPVRSTTGTPAREVGAFGQSQRRSMSSTASLPRQPAFTTQPEPVIHVRAGEKLRLEARIDAMPDATFRWYLNNFELKANANIIIDRPSPNHSVATFTRPQPGNYKCAASNDLGTVTTVTRVTTEETYFEERREEKKEEKQPGVMFKLVRKTTSEGRKNFPKKPRIVDPLPSVIRLKSSEALELNVAADAIPEASFTWRLNNFELKPNANVSIEKTGDNSSRARFIVPSSGRYEAIAVNDLGQDATSTKVIVEIPASEGSRTYVAPVFTEVLPSEHHIDSSRETRLVVSAAGQPPLAFKWYLNGTEARSGELCSVQSEGSRSSLLLKLLPLEDVRLDVDVFNQHGVARCTTTLVAPKIPPLEPAAQEPELSPIEQAPPKKFRAPRFAKALAPMEVNEGESLVAGVGIEKESTACEFVWSLKGEDVETRKDVFVDSTTHESLLTIPKVGGEMAGMIEVVAINEAGRASSAAELGVREKSDSFEIVPPSLPNERPPKIIEPLHSQMITEGSRMELQCKIDALPSAMISWSKDEREIEGDGVEANILPGGVCALTRVSARPVDSGLYKCAAANAHGTAETSAFVAVDALLKEQPEEKEEVEQLSDVEVIQMPPEFIEQLFIESEETENCVHLVCRVSSSAPTAITWYRGPQPISASDKFELHSLSDGTQSLTIHGVSKEDEGFYTCKAESEFGVSETSGELLHPEESVQLQHEPLQQPQPEVSIASEISADVALRAPSEHRDESADIRKKEEEFKLLVKVADTVADELVAIVVMDAVAEAARFIADEQEEESETETYQTCPESLMSTGPPRFDSKVEEYTARVGDTLKIETKIRGVPTPFIEWYCGERKLGVGMDTSMSYKKCTTSLTLSNIREDQTGMYYCHATNCHGVALLSCKVEVTPLGTTRRVSITPNDDPIVIIDAPESAPAPTGALVAPEQSEGHAVVVAAPETQEVAATFAAHPTAAAAAPVARTLSPTKHDETVKSLSEKLKTPTKDSSVIEQVNELMSAALAVKEDLKSDEDANVEIRRPTAIYEKIVTVVEPEQVELHLHTSAPGGEIHHRFINLETILQKPGTSSASVDTSIAHPAKRNANAEHRIVVLEGTSQNFSDAMTWSLKKVKRAMEEGRTTPTTNAIVEIRRPGDTAEQITTIAEPEEYIPELLQIASAASKLKMSNVTVSLIRAGDVAHQELVIEYESNVEDDADLAVKQLVFPGFSSHDEARWNKPRRDLFSASESMNTGVASVALPPPSPHFQLQMQVQMPSPERQTDPNVVAVFVEVEAACPDQSVEIVAVVATPLTGQETSAGQAESYDRGLQPRGSVAESASSMNDDHSNIVSISESSSGTGFEAPKFIRILTDSSARAGEPAVFKCLVRGVPMPEVRWSVDGDELVSDSDYTIIYEDGVCLLKINQVLPEDEGEYACEGFNDAGHAVTRAFLTVEQPPRPMTPTQEMMGPAPIPPPRRFVQHAPFKTDVYDEEIEGGAETDYGEEDEYASVTDLPAFCGSKKSLDRVSLASSKGRLVTSNSEFDLSRIMDYNQDLKESSMFVRYFDTAETMVVVRVLFEEEQLSFTCRDAFPHGPPTPKKRSIFSVPDIFKKKKAPPVPPKTQKSIEEYQKELMRRSSTDSAPTTPLTPRTETALEILEKAMENLEREATPKVEEEVVLKRSTGALEAAPAARQSVVAAAATAAFNAASPTTNVDEVLSFIDGLKEELSFATAPSETQTEDDLRNELMSLTAGMGCSPLPVIQIEPFVEHREVHTDEKNRERESVPSPVEEPVVEVVPVPPPRRKKEQKTPELVLEEPSPPESSVTVETPVQSLAPVQFEPEPSPSSSDVNGTTTVVDPLLLAGEPTKFVPEPSPSPINEEPMSTVVQAPVQMIAPALFEPEPSPVEEPVVQQETVEEPVVQQETVEEPVVQQETVEEPVVQQETVVQSKSVIESAFCVPDEEEPSKIEEASEAEIMLKRPAEHQLTTVAIGMDDFAHTAYTPPTLWNSAVFRDPFGVLSAHFNPVPVDEPRAALLPGKISFKGQEIGVRVEDIEQETESVNEQGTLERMMKKCKQATLDFDVPVAVKKLFSKSPSSTLEKDKKRLLEVDGVDNGLEKTPEGREIEPVTQKELRENQDFDNDEFVLVDKIGAELLLEEKDLDSIIDEESEAARVVQGAYAEAPERVTEASVAVIMQRRNTAEETQLNMELQRRRSEIPILTESDTSAAASPPAKPKRGMERRPTIESDTSIIPSEIVEDPKHAPVTAAAAAVLPVQQVQQQQIVVAEVHAEPEHKEENKRSSFTDDEGLLRPATLHDLGGESSDSSFHATESRTLPKEDSAKLRQQISKMKEVERIAKRVEAELSALNAASNSKSIEIDEDVKHIEEAIISISDQLALAHPVSEAQAEASEELLRTTLAAMILNPDIDPNEEAESLKKPIQMLRRKLSEIENSLMEDVEVEEELSHEEETVAPPGESEAPGGSERSTPAPKKLMKKVPSMEYLRVTPLTKNIKEQLITLENMIEEASEYADKDDSSDERPLLDKAPSLSGTGRRMTIPKKKELHDLFVQINNEINTIRAYCKKKLPKQGTEAVMNVLGKVKTHVTTIVNIMHVAKKKAAHAAAKSPSRIGRTYKKLRNDKEKEKLMSSSTSDVEEFIDMKEVSSDAATMSRSVTDDEDKEATPVPPPRRSRTASADPGPTAPPRTRRADASADAAKQKSATLHRPTKADIEAAIKKAFTLPASLKKRRDSEPEAVQEPKNEPEIPKTTHIVTESAPSVPVKQLSRSDSASESVKDEQSKISSRKDSKSEHKDENIVSGSDSQSGSMKISSRKDSIEEQRKASESLSVPQSEEKEAEPVSVYESDPMSEQTSDKSSPQFKRDQQLAQKMLTRSDSAKTESAREDSKSEHKDENILTRSDSGSSRKSQNSKEKSPALKNFVPFHRRGKEEARKASLASHFDELSSLCLENTTSTPERESVMIDRLEQAEKEEKDAIEAIMRELAAENIYSGGGDSPSGDTPIDEILAREEVRAACETPAENVSVDCRIEVEEDNWRADSVVLPDSMESSVDTNGSTDVESSTIKRTVTTSTSIEVCQMEVAMTTNGEKEALAIEVPLSEIVKTKTLLLEDVDSVQMFCEESDYGTDTETSCLLRGTARSYPRPSSLLGLPSSAKAFKTLSDCGSIREEEIPSIIEWDAVNVDLDVHVHQKSESIAEEFGAVSLKLPQSRIPETDNASMQDIESIRNFVMEEEPSSAPEIIISRDMTVLPTITERSEITTSKTSTLKEEDPQDESLALVLDEHALSQMASTENSLKSKGSMDLRSPTIRETDILSDESLTTDVIPHEDNEERVDIYIELINRRSPNARHILAIVAPEQRQAMAAALNGEADTFDIVIEQEPEAAGFTVRVHDEIVDYSSLYVVAPSEIDHHHHRGGRKTPVGRPQSFHRLSQLSITSSNPQLVTPSMLDLDEITEYSSDEGDATARVKTGVNVSIIARSMHDMVYASLEEIPWGEVVLALPPSVMMRSGDSASLQFNVTVSESYAEEKRSLHSSMSEKLGSGESLNIPSYSIKVGSTATITCELNNYLPKDAQIEWFRGKTPVHRQPGKVDRISHDLLEVLVISHVIMEEGDLYSLSVNGELFPVAYLVIEEADVEETEEEPLLILSPPQTLFVMDGQPAILSVQVVDPRIHVHWFKERKPLEENERIRFEENSDGTRTVVIREAELTDQGTYYAYVDEQMTSVTLVVEERIREREVHVPPSGTEESEDDSEMLREYLVPPGCTATIACELEASEEERELVWLRDDREIRFGDNQKIEHVRNGLKHYLVIHDTDPDDGGVYSVVISGVRFNVAHLAVNDLQTSIQKACRKRISNNSLH